MLSRRIELFKCGESCALSSPNKVSRSVRITLECITVERISLERITLERSAASESASEASGPLLSYYDSLHLLVVLLAISDASLSIRLQICMRFPIGEK
jgi:hypothetical protein